MFAFTIGIDALLFGVHEVIPAVSDFLPLGGGHLQQLGVLFTLEHTARTAYPACAATMALAWRYIRRLQRKLRQAKNAEKGGP